MPDRTIHMYIRRKSFSVIFFVIEMQQTEHVFGMDVSL